MPNDTVYVGRPSKFGNPFNVTEDRTNGGAVAAFKIWLTVDGCHSNNPDKKAAILNSLEDIKGKDLACWCRTDKPCHADVLLEIANTPFHSEQKSGERSSKP